MFDSLLGDYFYPAYEATNRRGQIIVFGAASMTPHGARPNWLKLAWQVCVCVCVYVCVCVLACV